MKIIFWIAVGALIGWNFPQPTWAKNLQTKGFDFIRTFKSKINKK